MLLMPTTEKLGSMLASTTFVPGRVIATCRSIPRDESSRMPAAIKTKSFCLGAG